MMEDADIFVDNDMLSSPLPMLKVEANCAPELTRFSLRQLRALADQLMAAVEGSARTIDLQDLQVHPPTTLCLFLF